MNIYRRKILIKGLLLGIVAPLIMLAAQRYTRNLVMKLKAGERSSVELWAKATQRIIIAGNEPGDLDLIATIIENNTSIPLILTNDKGEIISSANFRIRDNVKHIERELGKIKQRSEPIVIDLGEGHYNYIYYKDSNILRNIRFYPWVQFLVIIFFGGLSYMAFSSSRRAEENQVWVGMAKETAHQLGTPVSSLSAWLEIIREKYPDATLPSEMGKDINRLEKIIQRFSSIGSKPGLKEEDIIAVTEKTVNYLRGRTSSKVTFSIVSQSESKKLTAYINSELYEWVVENLCKNSIDAMEGEGAITIIFSGISGKPVIDFRDNGKGLPGRLFKTIFQPGYTTRKTGWGLGLPLARRIIEEYHRGKIYVYSSEPGKGTCIRISLNSDSNPIIKRTV